MRIRLALYQPDIPQNAGTLIRLAACCDVALDIIEPCGFVWSNRRLQRAGMDYIELANVTRHSSWDAFRAATDGRLILLTTQASSSYVEIQYESDDILLLGRESAGVPRMCMIPSICAYEFRLRSRLVRSMLLWRVQWCWERRFGSRMGFQAKG